MTMTETKFEVPESLKAVLLPGETVEWLGKSEAFSMTKETHTPKLWILYSAVFVGVSLLSLAAEKLAGVGFNWAWQAALAVVYVFYMFRPLIDAAKVRKSIYAVTNLRVISMAGGEEKYYGLNRKGLRRKISDNCPGTVDVLLGSCVNIPDKDHYKRTYFPLGMDTNAGPNGLVFYKVKDSGGLRAALEK